VKNKTYKTFSLDQKYGSSVGQEWYPFG